MKNIYKTISQRFILSVLLLVSCVFLIGLSLRAEEPVPTAEQAVGSQGRSCPLSRKHRPGCRRTRRRPRRKCQRLKHQYSWPLPILPWRSTAVTAVATAAAGPVP